MLALDTGTDFVRLLEATISDRRLSAIQTSAENVAEVLARHGLHGADCILSGLPFSTLDITEARRIMEASCSALGKDGQFIAYQMRSAIEPLLNERFNHISTSREWRNLPPCHLYWASQLRK
jgi:phospholipid N-methyltransferase